MPAKPKTTVHVSWTTVTYRSVALAIVGIFALIMIGLYFAFPEEGHKTVATTSKGLLWLANKIGAIHDNGNQGSGLPQNASFTLIDGTVRVKKASGNTWINADYTTPLEKGDVVQTGAEGIAKVVFADGTNYTLKQDSLIVIEESSSSSAQQTKVAVELTTGTVDLATSTYSQGNGSEVKMGGATASFAPESTAMVRNDPHAQAEVLVKRGSGEVQRGTETVKLTEYEKVSFTPTAPKMTKVKEIAPPTLIQPANMAPIFLNGSAPVDFSWTPVGNAQGYHVRVSRNPYFSSTVMDKRTPVPQIKVPGLQEGAYYWLVQSVDAENKESVESEKNRFTVIAKNAGAMELPLELEPFVQHGRIIEVRGRTEPKARVMINGQEVPDVHPDGSFQFFTPQLPNGENVLTITAQNAKGGYKTIPKKVVIQ